MVFVGGWGRRRRRYDPRYPPPGYDPRYPPPGYEPYGRRGRYRQGYGGGGGGSCLRDALLVEGGCCLAESLGCGPQLLLIAPSATRPFRSNLSSMAPAHGRIVYFLLQWIASYQRDVSPHRGACCRFAPTCSTYAAEALRTHGLLRGLWLSGRRLVRCRPGARGGDDPVPGLD